MDLEARLRNWGRWARGGIKLQTCGSAEKFFRSNWRQWCSLQDIPYSSPMDVMDAELVEMAWKTLSYKEREYFRLRCVFRVREEKISRVIRIKPHHMDAFKARAIYHMRLAIDKQGILMYDARKFDRSPLRVEAIDRLVGAVLS